MVKMIANRPMRYGTRRLVAGDVFDARSRDARVFVALKKADPYVEPPKHRRKAESVAPVVEPVVEAVVEPAETVEGDEADPVETGEAD